MPRSDDLNIPPFSRKCKTALSRPPSFILENQAMTNRPKLDPPINNLVVEISRWTSSNRSPI